LDFDCVMMRKAIALAGRGAGFTSPNPMVGAVIVRDGQIIGRGWHKKCGGPHAEVNAFASLKNPADAAGASLYVTLEPCSTTGRTPPCCDAIIRHGIARVVIGCTDPNPKHAGRAVSILEQAGIQVRCGVEESACRRLNAPFMKWIVSGRPYVLLKMAETLDGKTACASGNSRWITGEAARKRVAHLRLLSDAVLAGANTWLIDHPRFTARTPSGEVVKTPRLFAASHHPEKIARTDVTCVSLDTPAQWDDFLSRLGAEQITMLLIEGGGELASSAVRAHAVDEIEFHIAPKLLGGLHSHTAMDGADPLTLSEAVSLSDMQVRRIGGDLVVNAKPVYGRMPDTKNIR